MCVCGKKSVFRNRARDAAAIKWIWTKTCIILQLELFFIDARHKTVRRLIMESVKQALLLNIYSLGFVYSLATWVARNYCQTFVPKLRMHRCRLRMCCGWIAESWKNPFRRCGAVGSSAIRIIKITFPFCIWCNITCDAGRWWVLKWKRCQFSRCQKSFSRLQKCSMAMTGRMLSKILISPENFQM